MLRSSNTTAETPATPEIVERESGQGVGAQTRSGKYRSIGTQLLRRRVARVRGDTAGNRDPDTKVLQARTCCGNRGETEIHRGYAPKFGRASRDHRAEKNHRVAGYKTYSGMRSF